MGSVRPVAMAAGPLGGAIGALPLRTMGQGAFQFGRNPYAAQDGAP
jgi:hypothetical protein